MLLIREIRPRLELDLLFKLFPLRSQSHLPLQAVL
jgi:hypothetical protein